MRLTVTALALGFAFAAGPSLAQDVEAGAKVFNKCQTCHMVVAPDGTVLAGKAGKTGPNLYGINGRAVATYPDFAYGDGILAVGATGLVWTEADFIVYTADPAKFLKEKSGDTKAKTKMTFKLPKEQEAKDVWAFLTSLAPAPAPAADAAAAPSN
ncbi:c-type cytochrome [Rhodobacter sp. Har01]|uniref:c-type cytochrome n=1 Tax=Rhodobacter sp. Har01 TaxID=2883999 RepID=UPI001D0757EB|nr:c-type cytochrome [Rhodobacter sp. Har01]MCB6176795.1 c-type cytochrome [Rhodobacter sp. Har01]